MLLLLCCSFHFKAQVNWLFYPYFLCSFPSLSSVPLNRRTPLLSRFLAVYRSQNHREQRLRHDRRGGGANHRWADRSEADRQAGTYFLRWRVVYGWWVPPAACFATSLLCVHGQRDRFLFQSLGAGSLNFQAAPEQSVGRLGGGGGGGDHQRADRARPAERVVWGVRGAHRSTVFKRPMGSNRYGWIR